MGWTEVVSFGLAGATVLGFSWGPKFVQPVPQQSAPVVVAQQPASLPSFAPAPAPETFTTGGQSQGKPKIFKISVSVAKPEDLKVQQGDLVQEGQILADREAERSRLLEQKESLARSLAAIEQRRIVEPPKPLSVPDMLPLPAANFAEQEAAIEVAKLEVEEAKRALQLQQTALLAEPLEKKNQISQASTRVQQQQQLVKAQELKLEEIRKLKDLPESVAIHEQAVLKKIEQDLEISQSEADQSEAALEAEKLTQARKLQDLEAALKKAEGNLQLALGKLEQAKQQRSEDEARYSIEKARRIEERNQSESFYARHLAEVEEQKRQKDFQLAELKAKLQSLEDKLNAIATVKAPYAGTIRRIKSVGQTNNDLSFELTLAVNAGDRSTDSSPSGNTSNRRSAGDSATSDESKSVSE